MQHSDSPQFRSHRIEALKRALRRNMTDFNAIAEQLISVAGPLEANKAWYTYMYEIAGLEPPEWTTS